jgi:hypothetical protein
MAVLYYSARIFFRIEQIKQHQYRQVSILELTLFFGWKKKQLQYYFFRNSIL